MGNPEHLDLLRQGVNVWNVWRKNEPVIHPDLREANLQEADLHGADLNETILDRADLRKANLTGAILTRASLVETNLHLANLTGASLDGADLSRAELVQANLLGANLDGAKLPEADVSGAAFIGTNLADAILTGCRVYGISAWNVLLSERTKQQGLVITREDERSVSVDDLEVAQFLYLMLQNDKLRRVIDTITSKVVLILGRFSAERKQVLDALRDELRKCDYVPVLLCRSRRSPACSTTSRNIPGSLGDPPLRHSGALLVELKDRVIGPIETYLAKHRPPA